jgi:Baseplate J-like protein
VSFRRHTYPEVLDSILAAVTGGAAAEQQPFPPPGADAPPFQHTLLKGPVASIISVFGGRDGQPHLFAKDKDYKLVNGRVLEWQKGAELPDPGTLINVNYYPQSAVPVLTDIQTGSIVRTLSEAVALEMASLSAQLDFVYQSGFIDTASGTALDNVVALLGIERVTGGRASGEVEFTRSPGSSGTINIPAGTRVATTDGKVGYETTESGSLAIGQPVARIPVRDLDAKNDPQPAGALALLPVPIAGIGSVSNPSPTARLTRDETDDELRTRAKNFLHGSERATPGAIKGALAAQGIAADVDESSSPGYVDVTPHVDVLTPEARQRLVSAIDAVRPAGVVVRLKDAIPPVRINLSLRLATSAGMIEKDLKAVQRAVREKVADYLAAIPAKDAGSFNRLIGVVQSVKGVEDVKVLKVARSDGAGETPLDTSNGTLGLGSLTSTLGNLQITDPNLPTQLNAIVTYPKDATPPDPAAIQQALSGAVAYLNDLNSTELAAGAPAVEHNKRKLSFGKLLLVFPLPNKPGVTLATFDNPAGAPPPLPTEASVAPYQVQFVFTAESGFSRILAKSADPEYALAALERLSLSGVQTQVEGGGA